MAYIKREPQDDDYYDFNAPIRPYAETYMDIGIPAKVKKQPMLNTLESQQGKYLTMKSNTVRTMQQISAYPAHTFGVCPRTTGMLQSGQIFLKITHILIDSGATACCISRNAVRRLGLQVYKGVPEAFQTANDIIFQDEFVHVDL